MHGLFIALCNLRRESERRLPELLSPAPFQNAAIRSLQVRRLRKSVGHFLNPELIALHQAHRPYVGPPQLTVLPPVQRPVTHASGRTSAGMETVHMVTVRGPIFPEIAAALLNTAQRGHGPGVAITQQSRTDPLHTFYVG